jgi:hypothetical protein
MSKGKEKTADRRLQTADLGRAGFNPAASCKSRYPFSSPFSFTDIQKMDFPYSTRRAGSRQPKRRELAALQTAA